MQKTYIFSIMATNGSEEILVRAKESTIRRRQYNGYEKAFLCSYYDFADNYPIGCTINGKQIMNVAQFDKWLRENT